MSRGFRVRLFKAFARVERLALPEFDHEPAV
jgi:hypothetical protein